MRLSIAVFAFLATVSPLPVSVLKKALDDFNLESFEGVLTHTDQQKLQELVKKHLEIRRTRLRNLSKNAKLNNTAEEKIEIKKQLLELSQVKTENQSNEKVGIFEINDAAGTAEYLLEGDIDLTEEQLTHLEAISAARQKRQVYTFAGKWPNKTLYYYFDPQLNSKAIEATTLALNYLRSHTCLRFVQNPNAANRIKVIAGSGCYTTLGMAGGERELSLGDGCETMGTAAHEFMHALGVYHTHQRPDRNNYISINTAAIDPKYMSDFAELPYESILYVPYEYGSVMHYEARAGSREVSIIAKDPLYTYTMGSQQVSFNDLKVINEHYRCNAHCPPKKSAKCKNGGVPNPRNCSICNCPSGYGGNLCGRRPDGCGETVAATSEWNTTFFTIGDGSTHTWPEPFFCNKWITAPAGLKIEFKLTVISNEKCRDGCPFNGIEVKTKNQTETGFRFCCASFVNQEHIFKSELNPTPIITYNRYYKSTFAIDYRAVGGTTTENPHKGTSTPASPPCVDKDATCVLRARRGECRHPGYRATMTKKCKKSCGLC